MGDRRNRSRKRRSRGRTRSGSSASRRKSSRKSRSRRRSRRASAKRDNYDYGRQRNKDYAEDQQREPPSHCTHLLVFSLAESEATCEKVRNVLKSFVTQLGVCVDFSSVTIQKIDGKQVKAPGQRTSGEVDRIAMGMRPIPTEIRQTPRPSVPSTGPDISQTVQGMISGMAATPRPGLPTDPVPRPSLDVGCFKRISQMEPLRKFRPPSGGNSTANSAAPSPEPATEDPSPEALPTSPSIPLDPVPKCGSPVVAAPTSASLLLPPPPDPIPKCASISSVRSDDVTESAPNTTEAAPTTTEVAPNAEMSDDDNVRSGDYISD